ncbi:MAG: TadE/TadG family type IV pilus assembly protein [bacterium]
MKTPMIQQFINISAEENGQALVEMVVIVIISLMIGIGIYEAGVFLHNVSVLNAAVDHAATYASRGAPVEKIEAALIREGRNLLVGAFSQQEFDPEGIIIQVWNPATGEKLAPTQNSEYFLPRRKRVAEYMFWAEGYEIRVGLNYKAGIYIPFAGPVTIPFTTVTSARTIQAANDIDRDGMVDHYEAQYVAHVLKEVEDMKWKHPVHRDETGEIDSRDVDIDGDGTVSSSDDYPYDFNNDGREDKYSPGDNRLNYNPVVGPSGWLVEP